MYRVKGADQKEYGPISTEQVQQWIRENRLNRFSLAEKDGEPGWKPLDQFPEFSGQFPAQPAGLPSVTAPAASGPDPERARQIVSVPGLLLVIYGAITALLALVGPLFKEQMMQFFENLPNLPPEVARALQQSGTTATVVDWLQAVFLAGLSVLILVGGLKMRNLQSWGLALTAGIIAMLPCSCPCCVLGLPLGIWAVIALNNPAVKGSFR